MEKPKFYVLNFSAEKLAADLKGSSGDNIRVLFPNDGTTLLDYLTDEAKINVLAEFKSLENVARVAEEPDGLERILRFAVTKNPTRFYSYDPNTGFEDSGRQTGGILLQLTEKPKHIEKSVSPAVDFQIDFASDGAPAQQHRAPGIHGGATFLRRAEAQGLMGFDNQSFNRTNKVHVFVLDQGMDPNYVNALGGPGTYGGLVWLKYIHIPGLPTPTPPPQLGELPREHRHRFKKWPAWHAHMIVRNILAIAGDNRNLKRTEQPIKIYDVPVIPDRVGKVLDTALGIAWQNLAIHLEKVAIGPNDRVLVVNAWGIKNRLRESPQGGVSENVGHGLNWTIQEFLKSEKTAVVFAGGNNGAFTPDTEASPYDRGPGRSIWFPNSLDGVLNAGACDCLGKWIGSSSQGPGQGPKGAEHPLFVTPSYFREDLDAHIANTGSSASCGLLAGVIARRWRQNSAPLQTGSAINAARKFGHVGHSSRLGNGVTTGGF